VCFIYSSSDWRIFDDSWVRDVSDPSCVVSSQAYLLLYRRRDTPFSLPPLRETTPPSPAPTNSHQIHVPPQRPVTLNTSSVSQPQDLSTAKDPSDAPQGAGEVSSPADTAYKVTSTINTKNAACGNLVSNINVEDSSHQSSAASTPNSSSVYISPDSKSFSNNSANVIDNVNYLPSGSSSITIGTVDSSGLGVQLDAATPMSMSSTSQPSLSSNDEELLSTNQDDLDWCNWYQYSCNFTDVAFLMLVNWCCQLFGILSFFFLCRVNIQLLDPIKSSTVDDSTAWTCFIQL